MVAQRKEKSSSWMVVVVVVAMVVLMMVDHAMASHVTVDGSRLDRDLYYKKKASGKEEIRNWEIGVPVLNIGTAVGRGYNYFVGNPKETAVGGDKGYRETVFKIDTSAEATTADWRVVKGKHVDIMHKVSCSMEMTTNEISSESEVQNSIHESVSTEHDTSIEVGGSYAKVSASVEVGFGATESEGFKDIVGSLKSSDSKVVEMEAECSVYEENLNNLVWPEFTDAFKKAVGTLPKTYSQNTKPAFKDFMQVYGTHVVFGALMGSRYGRMFVIDSSTLEDYQENEKSKSEEDRFSVGVKAGLSKKSMKAEVGVGYGRSELEAEDKAQREAEALSNMASDEFSYSIGARPAGSLQEWVTESEADPMPISIHLKPLTAVVASIDQEKALALGHYFHEYRPIGAEAPKDDLGMCYISTAKNLNIADHFSAKSLVARCRRGTTLVGGSFTHWFNMHEDIKVDSHLLNAQNLHNEIRKYQSFRKQELQVKFLLKEGGRLVKDFSKERALKHIHETFGDRVDVKNIPLFLRGKLQSLGIKKKEALNGIANGLITFGNSSMTEYAQKILKRNPYASAIFKVSEGLASELQKKIPDNREPKTLSFDNPLEEFVLQDGEQAAIQEHVELLGDLFESIDDHMGVKNTEEAHTEIFGAVSKWISSAVGHIQKHVNKLFGKVTKHIDKALSAWAKFSGSYNEIMKKFSGELAKAKARKGKNNMLQDILAQIQAEIEEESGKVLLAQRNSLNWMYPHGNNMFVCGSGNLGLKGTSHSSKGYCHAYCCSNLGGWRFKTEKERRGKVDKDKKTATITSSCPTGYQIVSGGILVSDYSPNRFIQVTASHPVGEDSYKCAIKWTETDTIPHTPKFQCYARCARSPTDVGKLKCRTVETMLVNGHATVHCPSTEIALGGGWNIESRGVTYIKETKYGKIEKGYGSRSFRCAFGSSHDAVTGSCFARCCNVNAEEVENRVMKKGLRCRDPLRGRTVLGNNLEFGREMGARDVLKSSNGKFFLQMVPNPWREQVSLLMMEERRCRRPRMIARLNFNIGTCVKDFRKLRWKMIVERYKAIKKTKKSLKKSAFDEFMEKLTEKQEEEKGGIVKSAKIKPQLGSSKQALAAKKKVHIHRIPRWRDFFNTMRLVMNANGFTFEVPMLEEQCSKGKELTKGKLAKMKVNDNGDLAFYDDDGTGSFIYRFSEKRTIADRVKIKGSVLRSGDMLTLGQGLRHRRYTFVVEVGGALSLYYQKRTRQGISKPEIIFSTAKNNGHEAKSLTDIAMFNKEPKLGWMLRLNEDNNLELTDGEGKKVWETKTSGKGFGPAELHVVDGDIELQDSLGRPIWSFANGMMEMCESLRDGLKIRSNRLGVGQSFDDQSGGLVSPNKEYVLHVRESDSGSPSLEIWKDGDKIDCSPTRLCVVAKNVKKVEIRSTGLFGYQSTTKQWRPLFTLKKTNQNEGIMELELDNNGHLYAVGGVNGRHTTKQRIGGENCAEKADEYEWKKLGSIIKSGRHRFFAYLDKPATVGASSYNQILIVNRGKTMVDWYTPNAWHWRSHGFDMYKQAILVGHQWYRFTEYPNSYPQRRKNTYLSRSNVKIVEPSDRCRNHNRNYHGTCANKIIIELPKGHGGFKGISDTEAVAGYYYHNNNFNYDLDIFYRLVPDTQYVEEKKPAQNRQRPQDWKYFGYFSGYGKGKRTYATNKYTGTLPRPNEYNEIMLVNKGRSQVDWYFPNIDHWNAYGFDTFKGAIKLGHIWYRFLNYHHRWPQNRGSHRIPTPWKIVQRSHFCRNHNRNYGTCGDRIIIRLPEGHGGFNSISDTESISNHYYNNNEYNYDFNVYYRKVTPGSHIVEKQ